MGRLLIAASIIGVLHGQDALDILRKTEEHYGSFRSYQALVTSVTETQFGTAASSRIYSRMRVSYRAPNMRRSEGTIGASKLDILSDGTHSFFLMPSGKYIKGAVAASEIGSPAEPKVNNLVSATESASVVREESVETDGRNVACWVIDRKVRVVGPMAERLKVLESVLWIAKDSSQLVKMSETREITLPFTDQRQRQLTVSTWSEVRLNTELPDSLFVTPPIEEPSESDESRVPTPGTSLKGKPAPPFTLTDLNGTQYDLASLKGKTVLLNFWATWCEPCRAEMPFIELLHRSFREKGLVVLGVSDDEPADARTYFSENRYSFPTLTDLEGRVAKTYGATVIPSTRLIGPDGTVLLETRGLAGNDQLKNELQKLGIW